MRHGNYGDAWLAGRWWGSNPRYFLAIKGGNVPDPDAELARLLSLTVAKAKPALVDSDGVPTFALPVHKRYLKQLSRAHNPVELCNFLYQMFKPELVKELWYDIWLENHNRQARRKVRREMAHHRSLGPAKSAYRSESVRSAAKRSVI